MEEHRITAALFRYMLNRQGFTHRELAKRLNISLATLNNYLRGHKGPSAQTMKALVEISGMGSRHALVALVFPGVEETEEIGIDGGLFSFPGPDGLPSLAGLTDDELTYLNALFITRVSDLARGMNKKRRTLRNRSVKAQVIRQALFSIKKMIQSARQLKQSAIDRSAPEREIKAINNLLDFHQERLTDHGFRPNCLAMEQVYLEEFRLRALEMEWSLFKDAVAEIGQELDRRKATSTESEPKEEPAPTIEETVKAKASAQPKLKKGKKAA